jgi:hypothetical protein
MALFFAANTHTLCRQPGERHDCGYQFGVLTGGGRESIAMEVKPVENRYRKRLPTPACCPTLPGGDHRFAAVPGLPLAIIPL